MTLWAKKPLNFKVVMTNTDLGIIDNSNRSRPKVGPTGDSSLVSGRMAGPSHHSANQTMAYSLISQIELEVKLTPQT